MKAKIKSGLYKFKNFCIKVGNYKYFEIISILIYKMVLDFSYIIFIQQYTTEPYKTDLNIYKLIAGYILAIILYYIVNRVKNNLTRFILKVFYCLMFIPISTMYGGKDYSTLSFLLLFAEFVIIVLTIALIEKLVIIIKEKRNKKNITKKKDYKKIFSKVIYYVFVANTIIVVFACIYYNGMPTLEALNFRNVYDVRSEFYLPNILNYLYTFEIKFILTFFIVLFLHKKNYIKLTISILTLLLLYIFKGDKITLLSLPLAIGAYYLFKLYKKYKIDNYIAPLFAVAIIVSVLGYNISNMIFAVFVTRLLIIPANLKFIYFDFFSNNPKIGIVGTIFNFIAKTQNPYDIMPYQNLIAGIYLDRYEMYSNTGFLAEGYARFGYIGLIIIPIIFGIVLYIISYGSKVNGISFMGGIAIFPLMNLNDTFLIPSLTFGGILLLIIVALFFDVNSFNIEKIKFRKKNKIKNENNDGGNKSEENSNNHRCQTTIYKSCHGFKRIRQSRRGSYCTYRAAL